MNCSKGYALGFYVTSKYKIIRLTNITRRFSKLQAGDNTPGITRRTDGRWSLTVGRPLTRWTDHLLKVETGPERPVFKYFLLQEF